MTFLPIRDLPISTMEKKVCEYSRRLVCIDDRCPLQDRRFIEDLERYLFTGRTPQSINLVDSGSASYDHEGLCADRAMMALCFSEDIQQDYLILDNHKTILMTRHKCNYWQDGYSRWLKCKPSKSQVRRISRQVM